MYNGRAKTNLKEYLSTATCFIRFITNTSIITDDTVDPPVKDTVPYSITGYATNTATAITTTNRPNVYAHIYTDLSDFEKRTMYLVSPNTEWIADSLRILNKFSATYPTAEMNDVKYPVNIRT